MPAAEPRATAFGIRAAAVLAILASGLYLGWRTLETVNLGVWWLSVPLLVLEGYALISMAAHVTGLWDLDAVRAPRAVAHTDLQLAVLIPTYDESSEVLLPAIAAAVAVRLPHTTWVLDDGRCEAAVVALEQVREGFFLKDVALSHGLLLQPENQVLGWDKAIPAYLRIDRNSAHSFINELDPVAEPRRFSIFAAHDSRLSPHLADLAFLWALRLLSDPALIGKAVDGRVRGKRRRA